MAVINNGSFTLATSGLTSSQGIQYYDSGSFRVGNGNSTTLTDTRKHIDVDRFYLGNDNSTITLTDCGINVRNTGNSFGNNFVAGIDNSTLSLTRCAVYSASRLIMITTDGQTVLRDCVFNIPGLALYAVDTQISNITITGMSFSSANGFGIRNTYTTPIQNVLIKDCGIGFNLFSTFGGTIKNTTLSNVTNDFYIQTGYSGLIKAVNLAANWVLNWEGGSTPGSIQRINTYDLTVVDSSNTPISGMRVYLANVAGTQVFNDVTNGSGAIAQQELIRNIYTHGGSGSTATETRTPYVKRLREYGYRFFEDLSFDFSQAVTDQIKVLENDYVVAADSATALAVTNPTTANQIYDHSQATYAGSTYMQYIAPITTVAGVNLTFDLNVTIDSGLSAIAYTPATPAVSVSAISMGTFSTLTLGATRTIDLVQSGTYDESWSIPATGTVTVADGASNLSTWEFGNGAEINLRSGATAATVTVASGQSANITAGTGVTLIEPTASLSAPNLADDTRIYAAHQQRFAIASTAINTTDDEITLDNDTNGDAPDFSTSSPNTLIRFVLASGATIPTTSPQIIDGGTYRVKTESSGVITLSVTEGGSTIDFTSQGSGNFVLIAETELINDTVSGGSGYTQSLSLSDGALIHSKAIHWSEPSSVATCSMFFDAINAWDSVAGLTIVDEVDAATTPDTIHEQVVAASAIVLEDAVVNASGTTISSVNLPDTGSAVTGLSFALEGTGRIQINANDTDGVITWQELYLWGRYIQSTADGIRLSTDETIQANNIYNYSFSSLEFDNISSTTLQIVGGVGRSSDGRAFVATTTTGSVIVNAVSRGTGAVIETGVSGLTSEESTQLGAIATNTERIDGLIENVGGDRFTTKALEAAPTGSGGGLDAAGVRAAVGLASANLDTQLAAIATDVDSVLVDTSTTLPTAIADIPTTAEFEARSLAAADYFVVSDYTAPDNAGISAILEDTGTTLPTAIAAIPTNPLLDDDVRLDTYSTFDHTTDQVAASNMRGTDNALLATNYTAPNNAGISAIATVVSGLPTLANIESSTVLAKEATLTTLVPSGAIAAILTDTNTTLPGLIAAVDTVVDAIASKVDEIHDLEGLVTGSWVEAKAPTDSEAGYITSESGVAIAITKNVDGSERMERTS